MVYNTGLVNEALQYSSFCVYIDNIQEAQSDKLAEEIERLQERAESADTKNSELSAQVEQMRRDLAQTSADLSSQKEQLSEALQREASLKLKHGILLESFDELTSKFDNSQRVLASKEESASRRLAELSGELESKKVGRGSTSSVSSLVCIGILFSVCVFVFVDVRNNWRARRAS